MTLVNPVFSTCLKFLHVEFFFFASHSRPLDCSIHVPAHNKLFHLDPTLEWLIQRMKQSWIDCFASKNFVGSKILPIHGVFSIVWCSAGWALSGDPFSHRCWLWILWKIMKTNIIIAFCTCFSKRKSLVVMYPKQLN